DHVTYDSFGNVLAQSDPTRSIGYGFTGREHDAETGLQYNRARYYDPNTGRFVSEDPSRFASGSLNLYAYVGNDPVDLIDPSGLGPCDQVIKKALSLALELGLLDLYNQTQKQTAPLREQREYLHTSPDASVMLDASGRVRAVSPTRRPGYT